MFSLDLIIMLFSISLSVFSYQTFSYLRLLLNLQGELTYGKIGEWRFDKRSYLGGPMPRNLPLPPRGVPESVVCFRQYYNIFAVF